MNEVPMIVNALLIGGFVVTAVDTFKNYNPWSAVSTLISLVTFLVIN